MYLLSEAASRDIEQLLERSVLDFGVNQTEIYFDSLKRCLALLAENAEMGLSADDIQIGYRRFPHQSHVIFYREQEVDILIIRVLHKSMDIENQFEGGS